MFCNRFKVLSKGFDGEIVETNLSIRSEGITELQGWKWGESLIEMNNQKGAPLRNS